MPIFGAHVAPTYGFLNISSLMQRKNEERKRTKWHRKDAISLFLSHKHTLDNTLTGGFKPCKIHSTNVNTLNIVMALFCRGKL